MHKIIIVLIICVAVFMMILILSLSRRILRSWAAENEFHIISSKLRWLRLGPFCWTTTKNQVVFYITIRTSDGTVKKGWIRCGSFWLGVFQDRTEVKWEE